MKFKLPFSNKKKPKPRLVIDIGTETVKGLVFSDFMTVREQDKTDRKSKEIEDKNRGIEIQASSIQYFDKFSVFNTKDFEEEVLKKTILKVIEELKNMTDFNLDAIFLGLPADIFKGRVIYQRFQREKPKEIVSKKEEEGILKKISYEAKKKISQSFARKTGFPTEDFYFHNFKTLETKVDGYKVPSIQGLSGKNMEFEVLATFLLKNHLQRIEKIIEGFDLKIYKLVHQAENLSLLFPNSKSDAIFLDIGGHLTELFLLEKGKLMGVSEFLHGGAYFTERVSQALNVPFQRARVLKHNYSQGILSEGMKKRMKEIFSPDTEQLFKLLKENLKKISKKLLPSTIFIFGGGSLLPDISKILQNGDWSDFPFAVKPEVKIIYPKDVKIIGDKIEKIRSPQEVPLLLISYE
jgi:cell division ATPase FtsA